MSAAAARGTAACPARSPSPASEVARPRLRMNQLAMATVVPSCTPAMANARPVPKKSHICHGAWMKARPSMQPARIIPETAISVRAP